MRATKDFKTNPLEQEEAILTRQYVESICKPHFCSFAEAFICFEIMMCIQIENELIYK